MMESNAHNLLLSVFAVFLQEQLKGSRLKWLRWLNTETPWANRAVAAALAGLTTAGITYQWWPDTGTLHVTGLTLENTVSFLTSMTENYAVQWFLYKATKRV